MSGPATWSIYGEPVRGRGCGTCKACCVQVPVEFDNAVKPANVRCGHLCSKGCGIYARRPDVCRFWSCRWLFDPATADLRRPDHSGYVLDAMPDTILAGEQPLEVAQVWCDPARPHAHRDPALRAYLEGMGEYGTIAIVRWDSRKAIIIVPPKLSHTGAWFERDEDMKISSQESIARQIADAGLPARVVQLKLQE